MKSNLQLSLLILILLFSSCKKNTTEVSNSVVETKVEAQESHTISNDSLTAVSESDTQKHYLHYYVSAKSGLNYRDAPKGNVLGKFPLNTYVKVLEHTQISEEIKDEQRTIKGEWLGVEKEKDTVYVFSAFLQDSFTYSDIKIYRASPHYKDPNYKENGDIRTGFLDVSDTYFENTYSENHKERSSVLNENNLSKDTIRLNQQQREKFLKATNISELDKAFIYEYGNDSIHAYPIKDLPIIACLNIYFDDYNSSERSEDDYELGFDLGKSYNGDYESFVYVGKENPFQKGKFKSIIWKKTDHEKFPKNTEFKKRNTPLKTMFYTYDNFNLFLQTNTEHSYGLAYHLVVVNSATNSVVYENYMHDTEGTYLRQLNIEGEEINLSSGQWVGELFKGKPPVIYGFLDHSFGCASLNFLDATEPNISILCDNRH